MSGIKDQGSQGAHDQVGHRAHDQGGQASDYNTGQEGQESITRKVKELEAQETMAETPKEPTTKNLMNDNDNDNFLFDHNLEIEITSYNSLENQIINTLLWRLLLRQHNLSLA